MSPSPAARRFRIPDLAIAKNEGRPLTMLTSYDALTAPIFEKAGIDILLVGDSLGNVILGYSSTLPVTLADMERATAAVARRTQRVLIVGDLPFGTYEASSEQAFVSATRLMRAGAHAVKLEGGKPRASTVQLLTDAGIPVFGHLGYTPQSENSIGGPRIQGRGEQFEQILKDAQSLESAGAVALVLEMIPEDLATSITSSLTIPTIGIGAGPTTDGQVLVWSDMAGMTAWTPSFVRRFAEIGKELEDAARTYIDSVHKRAFPSAENYKEH